MVPVELAVGSDHFQKFCLPSWNPFLFLSSVLELVAAAGLAWLAEWWVCWGKGGRPGGWLFILVNSVVEHKIELGKLNLLSRFSI